MATPRIVTVRDFNTSRFSQLADTSTANIADILARAEKAIESELNRPLAPTSFSERFHPTTNTIYLRNRPIIAVQSVLRGYNDTIVSSPLTSYYLNSDLGYLESTAFEGYVVDVTYTAGFVEVPEDLKEAILIQAAYFAFQDLEIYGSGDAKSPGILYLKEDIKDILRPYRQTGLAYTS